MTPPGEKPHASLRCLMLVPGQFSRCAPTTLPQRCTRPRIPGPASLTLELQTPNPTSHPSLCAAHINSSAESLPLPKAVLEEEGLIRRNKPCVSGLWVCCHVDMKGLHSWAQNGSINDSSDRAGGDAEEGQIPNVWSDCFSPSADWGRAG